MVKTEYTKQIHYLKNNKPVFLISKKKDVLKTNYVQINKKRVFADLDNIENNFIY